LSFALLALNRGDHKRVLPDRREETLFALLFIVNAGVIAFNEGPRNGEALCWCLINLLFVLPWLGNLKALLRGLFVRRAATAKA
jgi:hypothetical protein